VFLFFYTASVSENYNQTTESYVITQENGHYAFKIIQRHQIWYQFSPYATYR